MAEVLGRLRTQVRAVPTVIWCVVGAYIALLLTYSIIVPTYQAPDEHLHVSLSHDIAEGRGYPRWDEGRINVGVQQSLSLAEFSRGRNTGPRAGHLTPEEALPKGERPSIEELRAGELPGDDVNHINQLSQHPPLYYVASGTLLRGTQALVGDSDWSFDVETWYLRLLSIALIAPLPLIIWRSTSLLRLPPSVGVAATLVPLAIPQLLHIGSTANNDSLAFLLFWLMTPSLIHIARGQLGLRRALLAGVVTGLALLTKGYAIVLPPLILAAYGCAIWRQLRDRLKPTIVAAGAYLATTIAVGGWWWLRNIVRYGEPIPSQHSAQVPAREGVELDILEFLNRWSVDTTRAFWGKFGWLNVPIPGVATFLATVVGVGAIALACKRTDRVASLAWPLRLLLLLPLPLLWAAHIATVLPSHLRSGLWGGLQGRYWFSAVATLSILIALGVAQLVKQRRQNWLPLSVLAATGVMNVTAALSILGFYWGRPEGSLVDRLDALVAWAPLPGELLGVGAVVCVGLMTLATYQIVMLTRRSPGESSPSAPVDDTPSSSRETVLVL